MSRRILVLAAAAFCVSGAGGTPTDLRGAVAIAHYPAAIQFSADPPSEGWCDHYRIYHAIDACNEQVNRIDTELGVVWYVLVAWGSSKRFSGVEFGFAEYAAGIFTFVDYGPCYRNGGLELSTAGWPGPSEGTAIVGLSLWRGDFVPVYHFAGYAYGPGILPLGNDPATGFAGVANGCDPPQVWPFAALGGMGCMAEGIRVCPRGTIGGVGDRGPDATAEWVGGQSLLDMVLSTQTREHEGRPAQAGLVSLDGYGEGPLVPEVDCKDGDSEPWTKSLAPAANPCLAPGTYELTSWGRLKVRFR